jgi:hypothetical protein
MESRKGTISTKNMINSFLSYPNGGVKPNSQRMRATWVVYHLTNATPLKLLLKAAGITTAHALVRFTVFVPEVDDVEARRILRGR